jgi:hypothetical protein
MVKLTPARTFALLAVAEGNITYQGFPVEGKPYYLVNGSAQRGKTSLFAFLRTEGFIRLGSPKMRGTKVIITNKGMEYLESL